MEMTGFIVFREKFFQSVIFPGIFLNPRGRMKERSALFFRTYFRQVIYEKDNEGGSST